MRKVLIIALGLVSFGALASVLPAFAVTKLLCRNESFGRTTPPGPLVSSKLIWGGLGLQRCYQVDGPPTPTTPWNGTAGYNNSINKLKNQKKF